MWATEQDVPLSSSSSFVIIIIIITRGVSLSLRRNPSLHALHNFLSFAMWPRRSYILDQIVAPSHSWSASRSFMSTGYPFSDSDCSSIVTAPRHVKPRPSVFAFSYASWIMSVTPHLFPNPVCTLSILEGDSYHDSFQSSFELWPVSQVGCC